MNILRVCLLTLRAELFKLRFHKRFYILAGFLWLLAPVLMLVIGWLLQTRLGDMLGEQTTDLNRITQYVASPLAIARNILLFIGYTSPSFLIIIIALIAAVFMTEERSQKMWKTLLSTQANRLGVLLGKLLAATCFVGALLLGSLVASVIFGGIGTLFLPTTFGGDWGSLLNFYGVQWLFSIPAILFAFLLLWFIRNPSSGIVAIFFVPYLIEGAYAFYRSVVGFNPSSNRFNQWLELWQLQQTAKELPRYFFTTNLYAPSRQALTEVARELNLPPNVFGQLQDFFLTDLSRASWVLGIYGLFFFSLLAFAFLRADID